MTLKQWIKHIQQWLLMLVQFPLPKYDNHMWTGIVGEREQTCLICEARGVDKDISDQELQRDKLINEYYKEIYKKYFGDEDA